MYQMHFGCPGLPYCIKTACTSQTGTHELSLNPALILEPERISLKLLLVRHLWGVDMSCGLSFYAGSWRHTGYKALEVPLAGIPDRDRFRELRKQEEWEWVPQVFTNLFVPSGTVREHLDSLRQQVEECLDEKPLFINCHSGSDTWSLAEAEEFFGAAVQMEKQWGIALAHETHRSRYFSNPWNTREVLHRNPDVKLTCDFSHWVCVAERLLPDCDDILDLCASRALHVHARVGYEEGPQVPDPRAPEWKQHLEAHENWWSRIWTAQRAKGYQISTLTPEFGPVPYLQALPYTQQPVADLSAICDWMAVRQRERFHAEAQ